MQPSRRFVLPLWACAVLVAIPASAGCKYLYKQIAGAIRQVMRDENGMVKGEGTTVEGLHEGWWTFFYEDGRKRSEGLYQKDVQAGPWTAWHENGRIEWVGYYGARGGRSDLWSYYFANGQRRARGRYREDLELGHWEFYGQDGQLVRAGSFDDARQVGWWTIRKDGRTERGLLFDGVRVGPWRSSAADGSETTTEHGVPDQLVLVREMADGHLRRTGLLRDGKPVGGWTSFRPDGTASASYVVGADGAPRTFAVFGGDGRFSAEGLVEGRELVSWQLASAEPAEPTPAPRSSKVAPPPGQDREPMPPLPPDLELWSADAPERPAERIAVRLAELTSPVPDDARVAPSAAPVVASPQAAVDNPRIVASQQPAWTVIEQQEIPDHVRAFLDKPVRERTRSRTSGRYQVPLDKVGTPRRRADLEGEPLPVERLEATDKTVVNLADFHGKKRVLLVVLRGFFGQVCVYCVAQTEALSQCAPRFDDLNLEVLILYPGPEGNEEAFLDAYSETFGKDLPPYRVFYDQDLAITEALGIKGGDLAFPTMIYVDEEGIVRYAYTGAHRADRPAANEIITFIKKLDEEQASK